MQSGDLVAGRFLLQRMAGAGGMAAVFQAEDIENQQPVALKVAYGKGLEEPRRFAREAELLASLADERIVRYVAHGIERGFFYLALEWLEGEDLDSRLAHEGLTIQESLTVVARAAEAIGVVHARGLVHRDVKPSNLFLIDGQLDRVKLLDFGIARTAVLSPQATRTGHMVGTPMYMAPEQASGDHELTGAVDMYALGCVLYECLTGQLPHDGKSLIELFARVLSKTPAPPSAHRDDIPPGLDVLVLELLAKRPNDRIATTDELVKRLDALSERLDRATMPPSAVGPTRSAEPLMLQEQRLISVLVLQPPARSRAPDGHTVRMDAFDGWLPVDRLDEIVRAHGVRAERIAGVGIVVLPDSRGDPVTRCARCALALREQMPDVHFGMATERAVMTDGWPFGEAVELALQLAAQADDCVLIDTNTARLLDARFVVSDSGAAARRLEAYSTRGEPTLSLSTSRLVGRRRELDWLDGALEDVVEARMPEAVLLTGAAGMGKSRIAREMVQRMLRSQRHLTLAVTRADPMATGSPYGLAAHALRSVLGLEEGDGSAERWRALKRRCSELTVDEQLRSSLEEDLDLLLDVAGEKSQAIDTSATVALRRDPRVVADAIRRAFTSWLAAEARLVDAMVILIEDLQWGDLPSVRLFDYALESMSDAPLLIVALARPEVSDAFPNLWSERNVQSMKLRPLTPNESALLVRGVLGDSAAGELVQRLVEQGEGNAFYLEELARAAREGRDEVPDSVLALAQARLDRLEPDARRLLRAASVFGDAFWPGGVLALLGDWHADDLSARLPELQRQQIIMQRRDTELEGVPGYSFRHEILREAAYAALPEDDRALAHLLAARWLEQHREADAMVLAQQWRRSPRPARAVPWFERAGRRALEGHDFAGALECVEVGLSCGAQDIERGQLHLLAAEAHEWSTDNLQREHHAQLALAEFPPGSTEWFDAFIHALLGGSRLHGLDGVMSLCETLDTLPAAREVSEAEVIALARTAGQLVMVSATDQGAKYLERTERRAAMLSELSELSPSASAWLSWARAWRALAAGDVQGAYELDLASARHFEAAHDIRNVAYARANVGYEEMRLGLFEEARESLTTAFEMAERLGLESIAANSLHNLGWTQALLGQVDEGREVELESIRRVSSGDYTRTLSSCYEYMARMELMANRPEAALACVDRALEYGRSFDSSTTLSTATRARVLLSLGRSDEAVAQSSVAVSSMKAAGHADAEYLYIRLAHIEALRASGDDAAAELREAKRLLDEAAAKLDERVRIAFLTRMPENARIAELCASLG